MADERLQIPVYVRELDEDDPLRLAVEQGEALRRAWAKAKYGAERLPVVDGKVQFPEPEDEPEQIGLQL